MVLSLSAQSLILRLSCRASHINHKTIPFQVNEICSQWLWFPLAFRWCSRRRWHRRCWTSSKHSKCEQVEKDGFTDKTESRRGIYIIFNCYFLVSVWYFCFELSLNTEWQKNLTLHGTHSTWIKFKIDPQRAKFDDCIICFWDCSGMKNIVLVKFTTDGAKRIIHTDKMKLINCLGCQF